MRGFIFILLAGLGCGVLGAGGGWLIGRLSPEFIALVAQPVPVAEAENLGAALGAVSGLLLGAGAMAFGLVIEAFRAWALRPRPPAEPPPSRPTAEGAGIRPRAVREAP